MAEKHRHKPDPRADDIRDDLEGEEESDDLAGKADALDFGERDAADQGQADTDGTARTAVGSRE